jgi:2'-hydroxyisoflavone reductase
MGRNILIIGGSYFVGRLCVEMLAGDSDNHITVVNRGNRPLGLPGVVEIVCDRHDYRLKEALPKLTWQTVIDFCAYAPLDVVQLMLAVPNEAMKHYIFISTVSVYADTLNLPVKEDAPKLQAPQKELGIAADYGYNKWQAEQKVAEYCAKSQIPYTILRPAIIYGKYNYAPRESYFFDLISQGRTIFLPQNELALYQFVSVWDIAKIISQCLGNERVYYQAFNLAAEELISYRRLIEVLQEIMNRKVSLDTLEGQEIDKQKIPLPFPLERHLIYSGGLIRRILDFDYAPFTFEMKRTWEWYRQTKGLNL